MESRHILPTAEVITRLQELTKGLYNQSESDYPIKVVHYAVPASALLTEKDVLVIIGNAETQPVTKSDIASFFKNVKVNKSENSPIDAKSGLETITSLRTFLEEQLQNPEVYFIGNRTISALLLGRTLEGQLLGLSTTIIQT